MLTQKSVKENLAKDHFVSENPEEKEVNLHDVDVNVIEDDDVPVAGGARHVIDNVPEYDSVLCWRNFDIGFDIGKVVGCQNKRL